MSQQTSGEILIAATPAAVVAVIADVENYPSWTEGMSNVSVLKRDEGGRVVEAKFQILAGPVNDEVTLAYVWTADALLWSLISATTVTELSGRYSWIASGNATQVTYDLTVDISIPVPNFMKRAGEKTIVSAALQGLKKHIEAAV